MTTETPAIEAQNLTKRFGEVQAVAGVDFEVHDGEVFGFLGPNGAGKTTTINMLTGLARPTAGTIRYFGREVTRNVKKAQRLMGIVPDESNLYPELNGFENLCFCASLYGMRRRGREDPGAGTANRVRPSGRGPAQVCGLLQRDEAKAGDRRRDHPPASHSVPR